MVSIDHPLRGHSCWILRLMRVYNGHGIRVVQDGWLLGIPLIIWGWLSQCHDPWTTRWHPLITRAIPPDGGLQSRLYSTLIFISCLYLHDLSAWTDQWMQSLYSWIQITLKTHFFRKIIILPHQSKYLAILKSILHHLMIVSDVAFRDSETVLLDLRHLIQLICNLCKVLKNITKPRNSWIWSRRDWNIFSL